MSTAPNTINGGADWVRRKCGSIRPEWTPPLTLAGAGRETRGAAEVFHSVWPADLDDLCPGGDMDEAQLEEINDVEIELVEEPAETEQFVWVRIRLIK